MIDRIFVSLFLTALICCGFSEVVVAQKNNTESPHYWIEAGINSSFKHTYYPATDFSQPLPNVNYALGYPFGITEKQRLSWQAEGGYTFKCNNNMSMECGAGVLSMRKIRSAGKDSVREYYDTSGLIYPYKSLINESDFFLLFNIRYGWKKFRLSYGFTLPALSIRHIKSENLFSEDKSTSVNSLFQMKFPTMLFRGGIGYCVSKRIEFKFMYILCTNDELLYKYNYNIGIRYSFI